MGEKLNRLTDLMSDLVPTVDKLASEVKELTTTNKKANVERRELLLSNIRLATAIDNLNKKIDRL